MSRDQANDQGNPAAETKHKRFIAGVVALVFAALTAIASGLGGKVVDQITAGETKLLSYSVVEEGWECGSTTYLPTSKVHSTQQSDPPTNWEVFQHQPGAVFARSDVVQVSIQGESARKVALAGIKFSVKRQRRAPGATFGAPCGGGLTGRGVYVDVEANPVSILASSATKNGEVYNGGIDGSPTPPITFPWSVSVTDPLLLYVVATADRCLCIWKAEIPWVSGGARGTIFIDNEGRGYAVAGEDGLPGYTLGADGWELFRKAPTT